MDEAWLAALDLHDDIVERAQTAYNPFVIPVLAFPDMEPDAAIESLAKRKGVYLVWGAAKLLADLEAVVRSRSALEALTMGRIAHEVEAVTDGLIRMGAAAGEETGKEPARPEVLSLSVGGRNVAQIRAKEMHLRFGTFIGAGPSRKESDER